MIRLLGLLLLVLASGCTQPAVSVEYGAITDYPLENLHMVAEGIYRSGQPDKNDFAALEKLGLRSVLNLRRHHSDEDELQGLGLKLYELPVNAGSLKESEIRTALQIIRAAPKPLLIHCWHGSDRTGAVVAAYRIAEQGWSVEDAIKELMHEDYGHHRFIYRNIPRLLRSIDWEGMKIKDRRD